MRLVTPREFACRRCLRSPKLQHRSDTPALSAEGTLLSMICAVTMVMLWGKKNTAGEPGQPPPVMCSMGTPNVCPGRKFRALRAHEGAV